MKNTKKIILTCATLVLGSALLTSCTWVKKVPYAESVRVVPADRIMGCRLLGKVTTYTTDRISVVNRSAEKVQEELDSLAKNEAVEKGADTIVRTSKVIEGKRSFDLYRCLN